jgi:DNA-directed RNA polymerase specialized sigma24 family protein
VSEAANVRELVARHHRRLCQYIRALMPDAGEAAMVVHETVKRIGRQVPPCDLSRAMQIGWSVVAERRKGLARLPFSDDLLRQLSESAEPSLDLAETRPPVVSDVIMRLPLPERDLLRRKYELGFALAQIAEAEGRSVAGVARDLAALHGRLVTAVHEALPDFGPAPPAQAADLGRLIGQLVDGTISDDGRLVLETLLLADPAAQAYYHRYVGLVTDLEWKYRGEPALPDVPEPGSRPPKGVSRREWAVTVAFVAACVVAVAVVIWAVVRRAG